MLAIESLVKTKHCEEDRRKHPGQMASHSGGGRGGACVVKRRPEPCFDVLVNCKILKIFASFFFLCECPFKNFAKFYVEVGCWLLRTAIGHPVLERRQRDTFSFVTSEPSDLSGKKDQPFSRSFRHPSQEGAQASGRGRFSRSSQTFAKQAPG